MHTNNRRLDHLHGGIMGAGKCGHEPGPHARPSPADEPIVAGRVRTEGVWQVPRWCSRSQNPEDAIENTPVIHSWHARLTFATSSLTVGTHSITAEYGGDGTHAPSTSPVLVQAVSVPPDSVRLRALQVIVTQIVAQTSGQTISSAVDNAINEGFSENPQPIVANDNGLRFNFTDDPPPPNKPSTIQQRLGSAFSALAYAGPENVYKSPRPAIRAPKEWFLWIEVRGTGWNTSQQNGDIRGTQSIR